jgi:PAS domain S-box-containing protein
MPLENPASRPSDELVERMRAALAKLEVALGATRDSIAWTDGQGRVEWCNAPFDRLAGKQHMAIIGQDIRTVLPLEKWALKPVTHPAKTVLSSRSFLTEVYEVLREGRAEFLEFFGSWVQGGGIGPIAVFVVRDVTARRQREEQLTRASAMLEALQESSIDGILIVDENGRILRFNERFTKIWGLPAEVLDSRIDEEALKHALSRVREPEAFLKRVRELYDDRQATGHEEIELVDGRVLDRYSAPIVGGNGVYYGRAWYFRDVTARKQADKALESKTAELARSNAELQQFASAASHDLMEPLRKVAAFGDLLRKRAGDKLDQTSLEFLDRMQGAAVRMGKLIEDLLQYSRVFGDTRPFQVVDLTQTAKEVISDLERAIEAAGASVEIGELPAVEAHPFQMRQLFQNLIANAIKFRRAGVPPRITISRRADAQDGFVQFVVEDNGIGFEEKYADKIFQPFLRLHTRQEYEGTGLGLAICRRILLRHGGFISAAGRPGEGSTFVITLPTGKRP